MVFMKVVQSWYSKKGKASYSEVGGIKDAGFDIGQTSTSLIILKESHNFIKTVLTIKTDQDYPEPAKSAIFFCLYLRATTKSFRQPLGDRSTSNLCNVYMYTA